MSKNNKGSFTPVVKMWTPYHHNWRYWKLKFAVAFPKNVYDCIIHYTTLFQWIDTIFILYLYYRYFDGVCKLQGARQFFVYSNMVILKTFNKSCFLKAKKLISRLNSNSFLTICQNSVSIYNFFISWGFPDSPQDYVGRPANDFFLWIFISSKL